MILKGIVPVIGSYYTRVVMMAMAQGVVAADRSRLNAIKINYQDHYLIALIYILPYQHYRLRICKMLRREKRPSKYVLEYLQHIIVS